MSDDLKTALGDAWPQPPAALWTADDTERYLREYPLPADFRWPHRDRADDGSEVLAPVLPSYRLHKGYGFWLRTTPYFPGLFEEIHQVLLSIGDELPTPERLAEILHQRRAARGQQTNLFS